MYLTVLEIRETVNTRQLKPLRHQPALGVNLPLTWGQDLIFVKVLMIQNLLWKCYWIHLLSEITWLIYKKKKREHSISSYFVFTGVWHEEMNPKLEVQTHEPHVIILESSNFLLEKWTRKAVRQNLHAEFLSSFYWKIPDTGVAPALEPAPGKRPLIDQFCHSVPMEDNPVCARTESPAPGHLHR